MSLKNLRDLAYKDDNQETIVKRGNSEPSIDFFFLCKKKKKENQSFILPEWKKPLQTPCE